MTPRDVFEKEGIATEKEGTVSVIIDKNEPVQRFIAKKV